MLLVHKDRFLAVMLVVIVMVSNAVPAYAQYTQNDYLCFGLNSCNYDESSTSCSAEATAQTVETSADAEKNLISAYQYFLGKKDANGSPALTKILAAAIIGNIAHESGGIPNRVEGHPELPKTSNDPASLQVVKWPLGDTRQPGWGLIQWTPSGKVVDLAKKANATGPIHELQTQLDIVWWHMNNTSPTNKSNMLAGFTQTNIEEAVKYYELNMEGAGVKAYPSRIAKAKIALSDYPTSSTPSGAVVSASYASDGCVQGVGSGGGAAIVAKALEYAWGTGGHGPDCEKDAKPAWREARAASIKQDLYVGSPKTCADCGGFVSTVIRDSGTDPKFSHGNTTGQLKYYSSHPSEWQEVKPTELQPGDIAIRDIGGDGHTYIYVGKQTAHNTQIASSAWDERVPEAGSEAVGDPSYHWYRSLRVGSSTVFASNSHQKTHRVNHISTPTTPGFIHPNSHSTSYFGGLAVRPTYYAVQHYTRSRDMVEQNV